MERQRARAEWAAGVVFSTAAAAVEEEEEEEAAEGSVEAEASEVIARLLGRAANTARLMVRGTMATCKVNTARETDCLAVREADVGKREAVERDVVVNTPCLDVAVLHRVVTAVSPCALCCACSVHVLLGSCSASLCGVPQSIQTVQTVLPAPPPSVHSPRPTEPPYLTLLPAHCSHSHCGARAIHTLRTGRCTLHY